MWTTSESFENWSEHNTWEYAVILKFGSSNCSLTFWELFCAFMYCLNSSNTILYSHWVSLSLSHSFSTLTSSYENYNMQLQVDNIYYNSKLNSSRLVINLAYQYVNYSTTQHICQSRNHFTIIEEQEGPNTIYG